MNPSNRSCSINSGYQSFLETVDRKFMRREMGSIYKPGKRRRRRMMEDALNDLEPNVRDAVKRLMEDYQGETLEKKLRELIGQKKAADLSKI
jgi:hypothetical protein